MGKLFFVIEENGKDLKDLDIIGRYKDIKQAFECRNIFKKQNPSGTYRVLMDLSKTNFKDL